MAWWLCYFPTICSPHIGSQSIAILWHSDKFILAWTTTNTPSFHWQLSSRLSSKPMFSCPKSLDLQGNFSISSLPRLTTIHSSFILFHNPDARCLPKKSWGRRQYHKIDRLSSKWVKRWKMNLYSWLGPEYHFSVLSSTCMSFWAERVYNIYAVT